MLSVRVTAAGAVFVFCVSFLTAPARACDDRFIEKCEKASAAAFAAEENVAARRTSSKRVRVIASRHTRHSRFVKRSRAPRFAVRNFQRAVAASGTEQVSALPYDSPMARRFRGFIDPQPIAQNAFEALRKPRVVALDFEAAAIVPAAEPASAAAAPETAAPVAPPASIATTPKQDKLAAKPAAPTKPAVQMELASAESRPVTLPDLPPVRSVAKPAPVEQAVVAAPTIVSEAPVPSDQKSNRFSFHGLVLALCGALGAASALRFIVGA